MRKAAVVIGVNKTGSLTPLSSAAAGAERVAKWLKEEKFDVECITDKTGVVEYADVKRAIAKFVTLPPRYHLLLVYFSGHGYWQARSDVWLLSGAPVQADEAISLETAMDMAKYSGIPTVVFVSDACRSIPNTRSGAKIDGRGGFPNYEEISAASKIDYFKATSEALAAYEGTIGGEAQSLLTAALMAAYEKPEAHMVCQVVEGRETIHVVPNRRLEDFLQKKVDELLAAIDPRLSQRIEANVPSSDDVYLGRARRPPIAGGGPESRPPRSVPDPGRGAAAAVSRSLSRGPGAGGLEIVAVQDAETEQELQGRLPARAWDHFETQMGFVVRGAAIMRAVASPAQPGQVQLFAAGDGGSSPGVVRVEWPGVGVAVDPVSVALQIADGRCVILAGLPGYIGHVTFDGTGMSNVSYVPSSNHPRWSDYVYRRDEVDRLRATVALAVDHNTLRVASSGSANALADRIRIGKAIDPTLGLYAAHAFSQAGNEEQVVSILRYMRMDLNADLFDIRLLATRHPEARQPAVPVVPFCPMLTQSWHFLRPRRVELHPSLQGATSGLCGSLWSTFEPEAAASIMDAVQHGGLQ
jgi:hypothetical protein